VSHRFTNPVLDVDGVDHGDPFVLRYAGEYYLYHSGALAIPVYRSIDLVSWTYAGEALRPAGPDHWAQVELWAPEVRYERGVFWMYVAGTRRDRAGEPDDAERRLGVATSTSPVGPFTFAAEPLCSVWSIDGHPFVDEDGTSWLFYNIRSPSTSYRDGTVGCGNVVDRLVVPDRLRGDPLPVAFPSARWEGNADGTWYWNEGPNVLRRRGGYFQLYSGGFYGDDTYGVGLAAAPAISGPWQKDPRNPIFTGGARIAGPGHNCVVVGPDGVTPFAVYHGYVAGRGGRKVHLDRLYWTNDGPVIGASPGALSAQPTERPQDAPPEAAFDATASGWHAEAWVQAAGLSVGSDVVPLDAGVVQRVSARSSARGSRVLVDDVLAYVGPPCEPDEFHVDGETLSRTMTSVLEDDSLHRFGAAGERRSWPWNGRGPAQAEFAVRGRVRVALDGREAEFESHSPGFDVAHLDSPTGGAVLTATAMADGSAISDLVIFARTA
jgi:GH43 family beta-xylosidase